MARTVVPPFSARNSGAHTQIDDAFPDSARNGLLHILHDLVDKRYVPGWTGLALELQRIHRVPPTRLEERDSEERQEALSIVMSVLKALKWEKVYDFCERLHGHLATQVVSFSGHAVVTTRADVQTYIEEECRRLFLEEGLAFELSEGMVKRRGLRHTNTQVSRAQVVLGDERLLPARKHFNKALEYFQHVTKPDPENAVKEAVCAVEAVVRILFEGKSGKTNFDQVISSITGSEAGKLPPALAKTFSGLYAFRGAAVGVAHGGATGGLVTLDIAEYVLAVAASQIGLLVSLASHREGNIPI
jgi:hypothetical protein